MSVYTDYEPGSWNSLEIINNQVAADKFNHLNRLARMAKLWNRLTGRPRTLLAYEHMRSRANGFTSLDRGVKEIPVKSIIGSLNRAKDYDRKFRPLNPALKNRWINIHMLSERRGWEPIIVQKVEDKYFVVDGHHRVSVARHSGWDCIEAQVYE